MTKLIGRTERDRTFAVKEAEGSVDGAIPVQVNRYRHITLKIDLLHQWKGCALSSLLSLALKLAQLLTVI
jgi:hypothetical protein